MYLIYEDDTTYVEDGLAGNTEDDKDTNMATGLNHQVPTPESNDNYVNISVIYPRVNSYSRGKVIGRKIYADGNDVGRSNDNPILDTREYNVEYDDGEVRELMANVSAESMYAACNDYGNEYLTMDSIVNYWKSNKASSVYIQKVMHKGRSFMRRSTVGWQLYVQ